MDGLPGFVAMSYGRAMNRPMTQNPATAEARRRRVELARPAFKDFSAQGFWSYRAAAEIAEPNSWARSRVVENQTAFHL